MQRDEGHSRTLSYGAPDLLKEARAKAVCEMCVDLFAIVGGFVIALLSFSLLMWVRN